jgi:hypothetical protein
MSKLKLYVSPEDRAEIYEIAMICDEWNILPGFTGDDYMILLMACHANHKLNLAKLKLASHEVMVEEIENFNQSINVDTLKLEACWSAYVINKGDMMAVRTK